MSRHPNQQPIRAQLAKPQPQPQSRSWWCDVPPGESITAAAERELERMNESKESTQVSSSNYVGFGFGTLGE